MSKRRLTSARSGMAVAVLAVLTLVATACSPAPPATFDSAVTMNIHIDVTVPGNPNANPPTADQPLHFDIPLAGQAVGSWNAGDTGQLDVNLAMDDGAFPIDGPGLPTLWFHYRIADAAIGTGTFDPQTGTGGFDTSIVFTVTDLTALSGVIRPPCDLTYDMSLVGQIDPNTGMLNASQNGFDVTPPGPSDCGELQRLVALLFGAPDNSVTVSFLVG